ncbi:hypothetical protein ABZP36_014968 [Zizania latifolia]
MASSSDSSRRQQPEEERRGAMARRGDDFATGNGQETARASCFRDQRVKLKLSIGASESEGHVLVGILHLHPPLAEK